MASASRATRSARAGSEHDLRKRVVVRVDVALLRKRHVGRFVVRALDQPHPDTARDHIFEILPGPEQVGLQAHADGREFLLETTSQVERDIDV